MSGPGRIALIAAIVCLPLAGVAVVRASGGASPVIGDFNEERIRLPDITLTDHTGHSRDLRGELTDGHIVVVNFNYSTCESICPMGNDIMALLDSEPDLAADPGIRLLSITIDPTTDTPAILNRVASEFGASDRWFWLTGAPGDIDRLLDSLDANVADITFHDPIFLVGDVATGRFYRSVTLPGPEELRDLTRQFAG
ncbi:SCO family protein [Paracoccus sp. (in: a-proteobacteria)]|uniref:SCO family protein n=1 Tax=Paracoccus sp. TaxID=267 RepID=UPI003A8A4F1A